MMATERKRKRVQERKGKKEENTAYVDMQRRSK